MLFTANLRLLAASMGYPMPHTRATTHQSVMRVHPYQTIRYYSTLLLLCTAVNYSILLLICILLLIHTAVYYSLFPPWLSVRPSVYKTVLYIHVAARKWLRPHRVLTRVEAVRGAGEEPGKIRLFLLKDETFGCPFFLIIFLRIHLVSYVDISP